MGKRRFSPKQLRAIFAKLKGGKGKKGVLSKTDRYFIHYRLANQVARTKSLGTLQPTKKGTWSVRIGGRKRGKTHEFANQQAARVAVREHYNTALKRQQDFERKLRARAAPPTKKRPARRKKRRKG